MIRGWKRIVLLLSLLFLVLPSASAFLPQPAKADLKKFFDVVTDPAPTQPDQICGDLDIAGPYVSYVSKKLPLPDDIKQIALNDEGCIKGEVSTREQALSEAWVNLAFDIHVLRAPPPSVLDSTDNKTPTNKLYQLSAKGEVIFSSDIPPPPVWQILVWPPAAIQAVFGAVKNAVNRLQNGARGSEIWADYKTNQANFERIFSELYKIEAVAGAAGVDPGGDFSTYSAFPIISESDVFPEVTVTPKSDFEKPDFPVVTCDDPHDCLEGNLSGLAGKYAHFAPGGDYVKDLEAIAARTDAANAPTVDRCGNGVGLLEFSEYFPYIFCQITLLAMDIGEFLLDMSSTLLLKTSGIPGNDDGPGNVFSGIEKATFLGPVEDKLLDTNGGALARTAYNYILGLCNVGVLLLLIVIALANILQVQVNVYSLKKLLPGLIIGLILANLSFFIIRAGLEISGQLSQGILQQLNKNCEVVPASGGGTTAGTTGTTTGSGGTTGGAGGTTSSTGAASGEKVPCGYDSYKLAFRAMGSVKQDPTAPLTKVGTDGKNKPDTSYVFQQFILNFFLYIAAVLVFILAFLFLIRTFVFFFAAAVAPFAFLGLYFPPLGFIWKRWSALVTNWIFMPLVAYFWIWMGFLWFKATNVLPHSSFMIYMMGYVFGIIAFYLAMKTPFTLAGEAKQVVSKWNDLGANVGKRYTPYGAGARGYERIKKNIGRNDDLLKSGAIVQNKWAKKLGGDSVNRMMNKAEARVTQKKAQQDADEAKVLADALKELATGKPAFIDYWKESNIGFVKKLGETLDKGFDVINKPRDKIAAMTGMSYSQRDAHIKDTQQHAEVARSATGRSLTDSYYDGEMGVTRAKRDFQTQANDKAAEKTKNDATLTAAHRNLASHVEAADPLIADLKMPAVKDVQQLMNLNPKDVTDPVLQARVVAYQKKYKNLYKASAKHIASTQKADIKDGLEKDPDELAFNATEGKEVVSLLAGLNHSYDPATKKIGGTGGVGGIAPNDISDYTSRLGTLMKQATTIKDVSQIKEARKAIKNMLEPLETNKSQPGAPPQIQSWIDQLTKLDNDLASTNDKNKASTFIKEFKAHDGGFYDVVNKRPPNPYQAYNAPPVPAAAPAAPGTPPATPAAPATPPPPTPPAGGGTPTTP